MSSPQIWLHLCFFLILSSWTNFAYAHRASLSSTALKQPRISVLVDGVCCSNNGKCVPCNGGNQGHIQTVNEPVAPYWALDHQGGGWEANELDPDWNPSVNNVGKVPKRLVENDQQEHVGGASESRQQEGRSGFQGKQMVVS